MLDALWFRLLEWADRVRRDSCAVRKACTASPNGWGRGQPRPPATTPLPPPAPSSACARPPASPAAKPAPRPASQTCAGSACDHAQTRPGPGKKENRNRPRRQGSCNASCAEPGCPPAPAASLGAQRPARPLPTPSLIDTVSSARAQEQPPLRAPRDSHVTAPAGTHPAQAARYGYAARPAPSPISTKNRWKRREFGSRSGAGVEPTQHGAATPHWLPAGVRPKVQ